ncbi:MAG: hypothetical protein CMF59_02445 [Leptospiraceae bacterium]|nr:hypothetical protein [Leptospiraceae bacterium]
MWKRIVPGLLIGITIPFILLFIYLFRPLSHTPSPASFNCANIADGTFQKFEPNPVHIYGIGLSYSQHIEETASSFEPAEPPPIFEKSQIALNTDGQSIAMPTRTDLMEALESFEPGLGSKVDANFPELPVLLDYEVELAFVILSDIDTSELAKEDFSPELGFFLANDVSARSIAVMGEGQNNRYDYWGLSKSFPGFLPVSHQLWIPDRSGPNSLPCITIETYVNEELRQSTSIADMIYTPAELIRHIHQKYPNRSLKEGDIVLMGTPGGVAFQTPRWLARLGSLAGMDRFAKLNAVLRRDRSRFLEVGDKMRIQAEEFGSVSNEIVGPPED